MTNSEFIRVIEDKAGKLARLLNALDLLDVSGRVIAANEDGESFAEILFTAKEISRDLIKAVNAQVRCTR